MKEKVKRFISEKTLWLSCLISLLLLAAHIYQYIDSGFRAECLARIIFCSLYPVVVFIFGKKAIPYLFLGIALALVQFMEFHNYTYFFIIAIFIMIHEKMAIPVICLYVIDTVIVCLRHDKSSLHLVIHLVNCGFIYVTLKIVQQWAEDKHFKELKEKLTPLDLTEDEEYILECLSSGMFQKEIDRFSAVTVNKKLKACRERNGIKDNNELLTRYKVLKNLDIQSIKQDRISV